MSDSGMVATARTAKDMPNYCDNRLYITGPEDGLDYFIENAKRVEDGQETLLALSADVPEPDPIDFDQLPFDDLNGWRTFSWGTNFLDPDSIEFMRTSPRSAYYSFTTAWGPPRPWLRAVADERPELQLVLSYKDEDDSLWRSHWAGELRGAGSFSEGFALFFFRGQAAHWRAAESAATDVDPIKLVSEYSGFWECERAFSLLGTLEPDDPDSMAELEEAIGALPAELMLVRASLKKGLDVELTHPILGPCRICIVGQRLDLAYQAELREEWARVRDRLAVTAYLKDPANFETEIAKLQDERGLSRDRASTVLSLLRSTPPTPSDDAVSCSLDQIGEAIHRLSLTGVLDAAGVGSEHHTDDELEALRR